MTQTDLFDQVRAWQRVAWFAIGVAFLGLVACMTVGYSTATDSTMVRKWDVTVIELAPEQIYNALGASLIGPFAPVEHEGLRVTFIDASGAKASIVQPATKLYELHAGQKAVYIVDRGQVWVQPADYPLPPEFKP